VGQRALNRAVTDLEAEGIEVKPRVVEGKPAEAIVETAREVGARLIVVGTVGENPITGAMLGSVVGRRPDGRGPADRGRDRARLREQGRRLSVVPETAARTAASVQESRLWALAAFYLATMRAAIQTQLQYRVANYFYMLGMVAEPVIYLVVWSSVADSSGGAVNGITAGEFAAYYIV
jgi:hypothetical protein